MADLWSSKIDSMNVQSAHITEVVGSFMSAASLPNVVGTFRVAGIALTLQDRKVVCHAEPENARRVFAPVIVPARDNDLGD